MGGIVLVTMLSFAQIGRAEVGYEYFDDGKTLHFWNNEDNYYLNWTSFIQFSNHYQQYYTNNIFCGGFYLSSTWQYYCTDVLPLTKQIDTDNLTYINVEGWADVIFSGRTVRVGLRYHLGENDTNLTIRGALKNVGVLPVPVDLGFAWRVNNIQINTDVENDWIEVGLDDPYLLNQTLDINYTNASDYRIFDKASVNFYWNNGLTHKLWLGSNPSQYNAPVSLLINMGTLNIGQEKTAVFYWNDPDVASEGGGTGGSADFIKDSGTGTPCFAQCYPASRTHTYMNESGASGSYPDNYTAHFNDNANNALIAGVLRIEAAINTTGNDDTGRRINGVCEEWESSANCSTSWKLDDMLSAGNCDEDWGETLDANFDGRTGVAFNYTNTANGVGDCRVAFQLLTSYNSSGTWDVGTDLHQFILGGSLLPLYGAVIIQDTNKAPQFNQTGNNDTAPDQNQYMNHSIRITDDIGYLTGDVSHYIYSTNNSGSWVNDTWVTTLGDDDIFNWSLRQAAGSSKKYGWTVFANDSDGQLNRSSIEIYQVGDDTTPPTFADLSNNNTNARVTDYINLSATVQDGTVIDFYILGTNDTGSWANETPIDAGEVTSITAGNIYQVTAVRGTVVGWRIYANDSGSFTGVSDTSPFTVQNYPPTHDNPILNATEGTNQTDEDLQAWNVSATDLDTADAPFVRSIWRWYKNSTTKQEMQDFEILILPFKTNATDFTFKQTLTEVGGAVFVDDAGIRGGAYTFGGVADYLDFDNDALMGMGRHNFTIIMWMKQNDTRGQTEHSIFYGNGTGAFNGVTYYRFTRVGSALRFSIQANSTLNALSVDTTAIANQWACIGAVRQHFDDYNNNLSIFVNGTMTENSSGKAGGLTATTPTFRLGASDAGSEAFEGFMDEVRVYNWSLTPPQINAVCDFNYTAIKSEQTRTGEQWIAQEILMDNDTYSEPLNSTPLMIKPLTVLDSCTPPNPGDWVITDICEKADEVVPIYGNVIIDTNGWLICRRANLSRSGSPFNISTMYGQNKTVFGASNC